MDIIGRSFSFITSGRYRVKVHVDGCALVFNFSRYFRQETGQNSQKLKKKISFVNKNRQSGYKENADWFVIALKGDLEIGITDK